MPTTSSLSPLNLAARRPAAPDVGTRLGIRSAESNEPLVDLSRYGFLCAPAAGADPEPLPMVARRDVAERLAEIQARDLAPHGYRWQVFAAWRSRESIAHVYARHWSRWKQDRAGWSDESIRRRVEALVDVPDRDDLIPSPCTGGAVDLGLWDDRASRPANLGAAFEEATRRAGLRWYESNGDAPGVRSLRRLMANSLARTGFVGTPSRYWRWELGTPRWAAMTGATDAPYGEVLALLTNPATSHLPAGMALARDEGDDQRAARLAAVRCRLDLVRARQQQPSQPVVTSSMPRPWLRLAPWVLRAAA